MRTVANGFLIYGLDPEPDLRMPPKEDDINKPIREQASQLLTQYDDAAKQQESKTHPTPNIEEIY